MVELDVFVEDIEEDKEWGPLGPGLFGPFFRGQTDLVPMVPVIFLFQLKFYENYGNIYHTKRRRRC